MRLRITKQPQTVTLLALLLLLSLGLGLLSWLPPLGAAGKLALDFLWLTLLIFLLRFGKGALGKELGVFALGIGLFFLITALAALVQGQKPWFYLWGLRNNLRFYVVFLAAGAFLRRRDADRLHRLLEWLFWLNVPVTLVQFFALDIRGDNLGGIFGTASGVNGTTNIFFLLVCTHSILKFLDGEESMSRCFGKAAAALAIAAMAELKFFFVLFLLVLFLAVLGTKLTWRKIWLTLAGVIAAIAGAALLTWLFPRFGRWFSLSWLWRTAVSAVGYTASGDLNRLNAIGTIDRLFFPHWPQRLFGFGLGACDTSSFAVFNTPFYTAHSWLHYNWMSHSFWYMEMGWAGLVFFFGFFVQVLRKAGRSFYGRQSRILAICCLFIGVYNASLRTEIAYLLYAVLAFPFLGGEER